MLKVITDKDKWIDAERLRWCKYFNIPMSTNPPPGFPINTISIQRTLASLSLSHPNSMPQAVSLFWQNFWVHWSDPLKPENLLAIVRTVVGSEEAAQRVVEGTRLRRSRMGRLGCRGLLVSCRVVLREGREAD
jgi:hypothetical protein